MEIVDYEEVFPTVLIFDNAFNNTDEIIDNLIKEREWENAKIGEFIGEEAVNKEIRDTDVIFLNPEYSGSEYHFSISQKLWRYGDAYGKKFDVIFSKMENPQLLHYSKGQGFYKPHADDGPGNKRIFSLVLYLNDVEDGGETYFDKFKLSVKPKAGRIVMFPASYSFSHAANPPKSGDKYAIVTWFNPVD